MEKNWGDTPSATLSPSEKNRKFEFFFHCLMFMCSLMSKLLYEKLPMFKIEYFLVIIFLSDWGIALTFKFH